MTRQISPETKLAAIFGDPVTHSLSPFLHNAFYEREGIDAVMLAFGHERVDPLVAAMRALPIHLAAVTMPHKQSVMPLLDEIDAVARDIGAVNTIVNRSGRLEGYNTDVVGIAAALEGVKLRGASVLLLGAGGAARCAAYHLARAGAHIVCSNRDEKQAADLVGAFGGATVSAGDLMKREFDVIVNATPIGMSPNADASPVAPEAIRAGAVVFDLIYSPFETRLLKTAKERGARPVSGLTMFLHQGLEQERLWLGRSAASAWYSALLEGHVKSR